MSTPQTWLTQEAADRLRGELAHLESDGRKEITAKIEAARAAGDQGKVRHLEEEVKGLEEYKAHHPEDKKDPTPLEVFCDLNPDAPECLVYDD